ncbi:hypothetical protein ACHAQH_002318 [Verticillium albo-atrum]
MELDEDAKPKLAVLNLNLTSGGFGDSIRTERNHSVDDGLKHGTDSSASAAKAAVKRRAPIACRSIFPVRGQPDDDRDYRHPRMRAEKASKRDINKSRREVLDAPVIPLSVTPAGRPNLSDEWDLLPPLPEIVEAVHLFTRKYFQLGFIPKQLFPARLQRDHRSVSVFLLLSILSISARFSLALTRRYQGEIKAADFFMERASALALNELYQEPTLERCQAFYLLSIAQQGSGWRNRSYINLGIATRMAVLMHLHREETYVIKVPTQELVIKAESARRTLWMLHSQDNLHCGAKSPISLAASDITCLLPSDEHDFACGNEPESRAALEDTPPARENPTLIHQPTRSLFASLIQSHYYWGKVARRAMVSNKSCSPWEPTSDYSKMAASLASWEQQLPPDHKWSMVLLKGHKSVGEDLAYMSVTMVTKLCNVVLRRPYLDDIIHPEPKSQAHRAFFSNLSDELFRNVRDLFEQIDVQFSVRDADESVGAQMASFCFVAVDVPSPRNRLLTFTPVCSDKTIAKQGRTMLLRCMSLLMESKEVWPLASRWLESLERFSRDPKAATVSMDGGMADGLSPATPFSVQQPQHYQHQATSFTNPGHPQPSQAYAAYAQQQASFPQQHNQMGSLVQAPFDQPQNAQQNQQQQQQQHVIAGFPQDQSLPSQSSFDIAPPMQPQLFTPPTPTALGPGNDGYEGELQSWFDESAQGGGWVGNGAGMGMGYY